MQNGKWILTSLVMTFFGIPILAQFLAAVVAMLGAGLAAILEFCNLLFTPTIYRKRQRSTVLTLIYW